MLTRKRNIINIILICVILLSVISVRGQFVEGKVIQRENEISSTSLSEQEIAEEVSKKFRSSFLENKGQVANEEIIFYGKLPKGKIAFGESKILLWMEGMNSIVTLSFVEARKVLPIGINELETKSNYFLGNRGTYTNVRSFDAIIYYNLWKGIDLYYQATPKGAKYEFRVAPGAKPEDIRIKCEGQEQLIIGKDSLILQKGKGQFVDEGLKVFQEGIGIKASFVAKGENSFGFHISKYDQRKPLIIDPLIYSTFVGGSNSEYGTSIALDNDGNIYVIGSTFSSDFPTTTFAYNDTYSGAGYYGGVCFIIKLSADGSSLLYSTYIGGKDGEKGESITLDSQGNAFVAGWTYSSDFPTTENAYNRTHGGSDCFVFKLSANGSSLIYSTFIGLGRGYSIILDDIGNACVAGETASINFPTTASAYNRTHSGNADCFVFKLSTNGSILLYSTFVGGNYYERGNSIALDNQGNIYVTGFTASLDFPTTVNAYDTSYNGHEIFPGDCFVFKLSADCSSLLYSSYVGGGGFEWGYSITLDNQGNAYITGTTSSSDFPTTENAYDTTYNGGLFSSGDCFISKLSADGSSLHYSTFIGGGGRDTGHSIFLDDNGNAYVTGNTNSSDFPTKRKAYSRKIGGAGDCFISKLSADGSSLHYSTFIGGEGGDSGTSIFLDNNGNAYVTGSTNSSDFPTTANAYDTLHNGGDYDCFILKLSIDATGGIGIPIIKTINLTFASLISIVMITVIIQQRRKRK